MAASVDNLESWLESHFIHLHQYDKDIIMSHIRTLFNSDWGNWQIINPPGDGFCGVYAMNILKKLRRNHRNRHAINQRILQCPTKLTLTNDIIWGIEKYRDAYFRITRDINKYENNKPIQDELIRLKDLMIDPVFFSTGMVIEGANPISFTLDLTEDFTEPLGLSVLKDVKRQQVIQLIHAGSIEILFFYFLAYRYEQNYIVLNYSPSWLTANFSDKLRYDPINYVDYVIKDYRPDYSDSEFIYNTQIDPLYAENTSILFNDGHYVIFYNEDLNVEHRKINELRNSSGRLWKNPSLGQSQVFPRLGVSRLSYLRRGGHLRKGKKYTLRKGKKHTLRKGKKHTLRKGKKYTLRRLHRKK